jgi:S-adenosyl-L-methionine hydrolase (adenosine-forming)
MPAITLLTDFGARDAYVGIMKGVIFSRCPAATVIDLTHEIEPGDIPAAAYILSTAWQYFPAGTVHVAVVDPGVGSMRRPLAAQAGGHCFIGPDNGVFTHVFEQAAPSRVVCIANESLFLKPVSHTFHGRDIFAPTAAALAGGAAIESLGPAVDRWQCVTAAQPWRSDNGTLIAQVVHVDHFGNLITNLRGECVSSGLALRISGRSITGLSPNYDSAPPGTLLALIGSSGRVEISVNRGSAARVLGARVGTQVSIVPAEGAS